MSENNGSQWTETKEFTLRKLWMAGLPTSVIALRLDTTANAAISKAHRMGLPARLTKEPVRRSPIKLPPHTSQRNGEIGRKSFHELQDSDCRFIIGAPSITEKCYCASPRMIGSSYCDKHFKIAYLPPKAPAKSPEKEKEAA